MNVMFSAVLLCLIISPDCRIQHVQWGQLDKMFQIYLCTGSQEWMSNSNIEKLFVALCSVLMDFMCPNTTFGDIRLLDFIQDARKRLLSVKSGQGTILQECLDTKVKRFLTKICCCPDLRITLKDQLSKLYSNFKCSSNITFCNILLYFQQDRIFMEFYYLTAVTKICDLCPGLPSGSTTFASEHEVRKRQYDIPTFFAFVNYFVKINDRLGVSIALNEPAVYLRHIFFMFNDLLYCFVDFLHDE